MTKENRQFISLSDIVSLVYECKKCHSCLVIPRERWRNLERTVHNRCPQCANDISESTLWMAVHGHEEGQLRILLDSISELADPKVAGRLNCELRFEVRSDEPKTEKDTKRVGEV